MREVAHPTFCRGTLFLREGPAPRFAIVQNDARRTMDILPLEDLGAFKPVNDRHGHEAGDQVLREVTRALIESSRNFSIVTRYGGDEFAVLLINTPKSGALRYADRIKRLVERHIFHEVRLTASIGVASMPDDVTAAADLMPVVDRALCVAKRLGRNTIQSA